MTKVKELFRRNAPDTSREAAHSIEVPRLEKVVLEAIRKTKRKGITQDELLAQLPHLSYSSVTARPVALRRKGLIVDSGERRTGRTGRAQRVLIATEFAK